MFDNYPDLLNIDDACEIMQMSRNTLCDILPPPTLRLEAGASRSSTAACTVSAS